MTECRVTQCPLFKQKKEVPFEGNKKAKIVFAGESPGNTELRLGRPFVGDSGELLKRCCVNAGVVYDEMFIANAARCKIDKKTLTPKEIREVLACCRPNIEKAMRLLKPMAILLLGDFAMRSVLKKSGITKARGQWVWSNEFNCWALPTFHPAYILRSMDMIHFLVEDLKRLKEFQENKHTPPQMKEEDQSGYQEVESFDFLPEGRVSVGLDSEFQGLDWTDKNCILISVSVSIANGEAYQIYFHEEGTKEDHDFVIQWPRQVEGKKKTEVTDVYVKRSKNFVKKLNGLRRLLESENLRKYMANGNIDRHVFDQTWVRLGKKPPELRGYVMDVQAGAHLVNENLYKMADLETLQFSFSDMRQSYKAEFKKQHDIGDLLKAVRENRESVTKYACGDADVTRRVGLTIAHQLIRPSNRKVARYLSKLVMPALGALHTMEKHGAKIDAAMLPVITREVEESVKSLHGEALSLIPEKVKKKHKDKLSLTRKDLIRDTLFSGQGFKLVGEKRTSTNTGWSVDKETRVLLMDQMGIGEDAVRFLELFNEYSDDYTMLSRYLSGFRNAVKQDGRIHTSYSLVATVTGRSSSRNPNMQNNPKRSKQSNRIRRLIVARPGYLLLAADEEQSELRWSAQLSKDPEMIRIFSTGQDIHMATAMDLGHFSRERWSALSPQEIDLERRKAKAVNFGLLFKMSAMGFVKYAKKDYGLDLSEEEAELWKAKFFQKYSRLLDYHDRMIEFGRSHGYVESPLGRRRHLPELMSNQIGLRNEAERQAVNHPIQSPSSDIVLLAASEILRKNLFDPADVRNILFVHDELVFEVRDCSRVADFAKAIKYEMENPPLKSLFDIDMVVPLQAEIKIGKNLADMQKLK